MVMTRHFLFFLEPLKKWTKSRSSVHAPAPAIGTNQALLPQDIQDTRFD